MDKFYRGHAERTGARRRSSSGSGSNYYNAKNYPAAAKYLGVLSKAANALSVKPDFWFYLGDAQMRLNQPAEAENSLQNFLQTATDPAARAKALLALGRGQDRRP